MASIEFIQKRVDGAKTKIEKLNKKLERIEIAKASNYEENNPYCYSDYDLRYTVRDLEEAKGKTFKNTKISLQKNKKRLEIEMLKRSTTSWTNGCKTVLNISIRNIQNTRPPGKNIFEKIGSIASALTTEAIRHQKKEKQTEKNTTK